MEYKNEVSCGDNFKWKTMLFKLFRGEVLIQNHQNLQLEPFETTVPFAEHNLFNPDMNQLYIWK
jgi:hypothetical protein